MSFSLFRVLFVFPLLMCFLSSNVIADDKYSSSYSADDYLSAILSGSFSRALEMVNEDLENKIREVIVDEEARDKVLYRISERIIKKLDDILNDSSKDDVTRSKDIATLINSSLLEYQSTENGPLDLKLRYSKDYLTTRVSWDRRLETLDCNEGKVVMRCSTDGSSCSYDIVYERVRYTIEPDYRIYRLVDGNKDKITTVEGRIYGGEVVFSTEPNKWAKKIWEAISNSGTEFNDPGEAVFFDFETDIRPSGSTLAYRVEADSGRFWNKSSGSDTFCDSSSSWVSQAPFDSNGDSYADFIPLSAYGDGNIINIINFILSE